MAAKKKVLISISAIIGFILVAMVYLKWRNESLSPAGTVSLANGGVTTSIKYSRPSVRGRIVFGTADQKALQPYGAYWRLGANEATEITFDKDVIFNKQPLKAGSYRLYAFPGAETFDIGVNSELGKWGYSEPDYTKDILRTTVPVYHNETPVEQFTISMKPGTDGGTEVIFDWAHVRFIIPVLAQ